MSLLSWDKPKKARSTEGHNKKFQSDTGIPGTFVPNMADEDKYRWKAKKIGGKNPRVEIRKTTDGKSPLDGSNAYAQILLIVFPDSLQFSMNGKAVLDQDELVQAIAEGSGALSQAFNRDPDSDCDRFKQGHGTPKDMDCVSGGHYMCGYCIHNATREKQEARNV